MSIQGYNVYRKDRNLHGGGVAIYIQSHIPSKMRQDLIAVGVEALWLQVQLLYVKENCWLDAVTGHHVQTACI